MSKRRYLAAACVALAAVAAAVGGDWPQWRGPNRDGISTETGLMKSWPEGGPKQLWSIKTPGMGYAAPSVVGDTIYLAGTEGAQEVLYALGLDGKLKWKQPFSAAWRQNYPMARTSPTVQDGSLYLFSSMGVAVCLDAKTGAKKWSVDTADKFGGKNIQWGIAESPLIIGEKFICHPGGPDAAVVALNKDTGETIWQTKGLADKSAYDSPLLVKVGELEQIVTQTENHIIGVRVKDGAVLWKKEHRNRWAVHPNTPLFFSDSIYVSSGYRYGSELLKLTADGKAQPVWHEKALDSHHSGVLLIDGYIYGASSGSTGLICLDPKTGKPQWTAPEAFKAAIVYADGRLYAYTERGDVLLMEVSPKEYKIVGKFKITEGSKEHWAHPVVANGVLYIRHGEAFMAYDVKAK